MNTKADQQLSSYGDLGFKILTARSYCVSTRERLDGILDIIPENESEMDPSAALQIGWQIGSMQRNLASTASVLDEQCPDMDPQPSALIEAQSSVPGEQSLVGAVEAAKRCLLNMEASLDLVSEHVVGEIDAEIDGGKGPDDEIIRLWLEG